VFVNKLSSLTACVLVSKAILIIRQRVKKYYEKRPKMMVWANWGIFNNGTFANNEERVR
jgi:hypothetical protein